MRESRGFSQFYLHNLVLPGLGQYLDGMLPEKALNVKPDFAILV
jgi:hypothetical protein